MRCLQRISVSRRDFDVSRRRPGGPYVESFYVDCNRKVHEGSKWQWSRGDKEKESPVPTL
ncbi:unnamed protein product [Gongylonema pulchrum]|uniref:Uncharacterized protein n=1 Tax=Gongylonema pulchrum TaxID=637853 RepID=A0A3P6QLM2_9BILA|nr:unnamed protein product [Gongylonema pulchrum]